MTETPEAINASPLAQDRVHPLHCELPSFGLHVHSSSALGTLLTIVSPHDAEHLARRYERLPISVAVQHDDRRGCLVWMVTALGGGAYPGEPFGAAMATAWARFPLGFPPLTRGSAGIPPAMPEDEMRAPTVFTLAVANLGRRVALARRLEGGAGVGRKLRDMVRRDRGGVVEFASKDAEAAIAEAVGDVSGRESVRTWPCRGTFT